MKRKRNKTMIIILLSVFILFFIKYTYCKYTYQISKDILFLYRDINPPKYEILYSKDKITNENVLLNIKFDKYIDKNSVEGFEWDKENKILSRTLEENEEKEIFVKDLSGNLVKISYNVDWIDKEKPQIVGVENGKSYTAPITIAYTDNVEIKNIEAKYMGDLKLDFHTIYHDTAEEKSYNFTDTTCTVKITSAPKNAVKYKFYVNDALVAVTSQREYTYENLPKGTVNIPLKVEAIDIDGNVLDIATKNGRTGFFKNFEMKRIDTGISIKITGIDTSINYLKCYYWKAIDNSSTSHCKKVTVTDGTVELTINKSEFNNYSGTYILHLYFFDENNVVKDILGYEVDFIMPNIQDIEDLEETEIRDVDPYYLTISGVYSIYVEDTAGNYEKYIINIL